jgi:hypothetical protein
MKNTVTNIVFGSSWMLGIYDSRALEFIHRAMIAAIADLSF